MSAEDNAAGGSAESNFVPKHKSSSIIWRYFGFRKDDGDQSEVLCKSCLAKIATKQGNTSNLFHHLKQHHRVLHDECMTLKQTPGTSQSSLKRPKQTMIADALSSVTPYESTSSRHKVITESITYHLAKDMVPVYTVSKEGFKNMVHTLDKHYKLPSRTHFSQVAIPKLYNECKMNVESKLREIDHFATTTDLWSSRTTEPYISLTLHFITTNFELKTRCLQTSFFPGEHTGDNIAQEMRGALADWDLKEDQQVCVTTDNASNMIKALEVNGWTRLQCFGHRLHLAIENAVKGDNRISRATGVCKKLVCHFSHSWKKRVALDQAQKRLNLPVHGLITECQTRWGSRVLMINRILEQQKALHEVLSEDRNTRHPILGHQDLDVLESVSKALGPLLEFTDALSGEDYVSVSHIKPVLNLFNTTILAPEEDDTDMTKSLKKKMLEYMNSKYEDRVTQELLDVASFLDPRYETQYISVNDVPNIRARLVSEMKTMEHKHSVESTRVEEVSPPPTKKAKKSLASFFKKSTASATVPIDPTAAIEAELSAYLLSSTIDNEEDPLLWWRTHKVNFPRLSNMARKYLCMQATSSPSERIFSASGNIVSCERSCLKPDMVNKLVFLAKNL